MTEMRSFLGMSLQRALLDEVSAALRGVAVRYHDGRVDLVFYVDGPVSEDDRESASIVETELLADLSPNYTVKTDIIQIDAPAPLPESDFWVYRRRED
jgi:hypothetical protein